MLRRLTKLGWIMVIAESVKLQQVSSSLTHPTMLLSSNGRTPASQADVNAGSIPVKSTKIGLTSGVGTGVLR